MWISSHQDWWISVSWASLRLLDTCFWGSSVFRLWLIDGWYFRWNATEFLGCCLWRLLHNLRRSTSFCSWKTTTSANHFTGMVIILIRQELTSVSGMNSILFSSEGLCCAFFKTCPPHKMILLMAEIQHQLRLVVYPIIYDGFYTSQVVSRISSTKMMPCETGKTIQKSLSAECITLLVLALLFKVMI